MGKNITDNNSLEGLRQVFLLLDQKLGSQEINNERLIRTVMKSKMKWINQDAYFQWFLLVPFISLCCFFLYRAGIVSLPLSLITVFLMLGFSSVDIYINKVMGKEWMEEDLLTSRATLLKMRQTRYKVELVFIPVSIVWIAAIYFDFYFYLQDQLPLFYSLLIGGVVEGIIDRILSYSIYKKMQSTNDELINEIDRFKNQDMDPQ